MPPLMFASVNIVDKFLVHGSEEDSKPGALLAITGLFNLIAASLVGAWMIHIGQSIKLSLLVPLMLNGIVYVSAMWIYLHVLREEDASRVIPWFQTIPVFGVVGAFIVLQELPRWYELGAIGLLVIGGFILSVKNGVAKRRVAVLMVVASGLVAANDVIFAEFGRQADGAPAIFADMLGKSVFGLIFLVHGPSCRGFKMGLRTKFGVQSGSELVNIGADMFLDLAKLYMPIALVQAACATQPLFVLVGATIIAKFSSKFSNELEGNQLIKVAGVILMVVGGAILAASTA